MSTEFQDVAGLRRIQRGRTADALARAAYDALLDDLSRVDAGDWDRPTECTGWSVRDMVAHLVGAAQGHASLPVFVRQYARGLRRRAEFGGSALDAMNQGQIDGLAGRTGEQLVAMLQGVAGRALAGRARNARLLGWAPVGLDQAGSWYAGMPVRTSMGDLCSVVLTRDVWAHRLDLARALDRQPVIDPETDGAVVADLVADWAGRHGQQFALILTGPAGGQFRAGRDGEPLTLDALDFGRVMAGRRPEGAVPESALWATKALF